MLYTSNGEARQEFSIVLTARATGGEPTGSEESSEVRWVPRVDSSGRLFHGPVDAAADRALPRGTGHAVPGLSLGLPGAGGSGVDLADGLQDERGGAADGAADQVARAVAVVDLGQAVCDLDVLAAGAGRILRRVAAGFGEDIAPGAASA